MYNLKAHMTTKLSAGCNYYYYLCSNPFNKEGLLRWHIPTTHLKKKMVMSILSTGLWSSTLQESGHWHNLFDKKGIKSVIVKNPL